MRSAFRTTLCGAAIAAATALSAVATSAQQPVQVPLPSQTVRPMDASGWSGPSRGQMVLATGCVQRESEYRNTHRADGDIVIIGSGNDLVLNDVAVDLGGSQVAGTFSQQRPIPVPMAESSPIF